jgi:glycine/D-amino acid oxidase-like deaminating enzyme
VGAGILGAALAQRLTSHSWPITLVDQYPPGHARAASAGSSRIIRSAHGGDSTDTESAWQSLKLWRELERVIPAKLLTETGLAFFVQENDPWLRDSCHLLQAFEIPHKVLDGADARNLFPSLSLAASEVVLLEESAGILQARQAVSSLVRHAVANGAKFVAGRATPAGEGVTIAGEHLAADATVWACGAWNARLFPEFIDSDVIEQDNFYFSVPAAWKTPPVPAWSDRASKVSGTGDFGGQGVKVGADCPGPTVDLDGARGHHDRTQESAARGYLGRRFPELAGAPLVGVETCHSAVVRFNGLQAVSTRGELQIARHPEFPAVWVLGDGAGHAFKHAPAIASLMEELLT